jgi:hypothetical protein
VQADDPVPPAAVGGLLKQAAATAYCRSALRALGGALPPDDRIFHTGLHEAAKARDAKAFSHLYLAGLFAGRRIPAEVMDLGAALLPEAMLLLYTALRLDGKVAEPLATAVRSGRMGSERDATALVVALLDYERRETPAPFDFLVLLRKVSRTCSRQGGPVARPLLCVAARLANDPITASILNADIANDRGLDSILAEMRRCSTAPAWENTIPTSPVSEKSPGHGATLKRAAPKAGRNDPCPCGSGRKFKQCCEGKTRMSDQYEVDGVTLSEATAHPELLLTRERIREMRSYELYTLDPRRLIPPLVEQVAIRLVIFGEIPRAIEMLKTAGPDSFSRNALDEIAFELYRARAAEALRELVDWAAGAIDLSFEMEVLHAKPEERLRLLQERARDAFEAERSGEKSATMAFCDLGFAALVADPVLGIVIARGVLPVCGWANQSVLLEDIEDARDLLGLDNHEPGYEVLDASERLISDEDRHASDLDKVRKESASRVNERDAEIQRLKSRIDAMQETLVQREKAAEQTDPQPASGATAPAPARDLAETRNLREQLRRLKDNLKIEHDERNRALRDLRAAQDQLRRAPRDTTSSSQGNPPANLTEEDEPNSISIEWERQPLRIPEYSKAFREALHNHPRQAAGAAITAAGRLAAGDPSIWKTVRALRMRPGTLRVRIAGDYRLLFETGPADTLHLIDFILRRDLDRWLSAGG